MNEKDIVCPKCNHICRQDDTFCCHCGYNLDEIKKSKDFEEDKIETKYCPKCGKSCAADENFCSACGYSFAGRNSETENKTKSVNKFTMLVTGTVIFGFFVYILMKIIGSIPYEEQLKPTPAQDEDYSVVKAKSCHEKEVKDIALQIFKENDYYYKYIDQSTISDVSLKFPTMDSYNSETDKYYCKGTVFVIADSKGFAPSSYEFGNHYYDEISEDYDTNEQPKKKYTRYQCEINYASQISQNQVYVTATACGNGTGFDFNNKGKFTYTVVQPKPKQTEQPKTEQIEEEQEEQESENMHPQDEVLQTPSSAAINEDLIRMPQSHPSDVKPE